MGQTNDKPRGTRQASPLSDEVIRELYHSVNDTIFVHVAETGEILDVNETVCDMYGYTRAEARQLSIEDLSSGVPPYTQDTAVDYIQKAAEGNPQQFDWQAEDSDGNRFWVEVSMRRAIIDDQMLVLVIVRDVTERKRYEEQLEKTTEELEALNQVVGHDIRNDMAIILGWAELLEDHVDDHGQEYLRKILTSGVHIVDLTKSAREYIETLTSEDDLAVSPTPLRSLLETELNLRRESFPDAEFVLVEDVPDVSVVANEMLGAVFRNLLNNAVQHNDKDTPVVRVSCEINAGDVVVEIADNGPGIPDDRKNSIFGKGDQGLESSGTGIGLALVQTLVNQYGGSVTVEDNEPEGAVFTVRLSKAD